jgi:Flp pilus assembly protein TadD
MLFRRSLPQCPIPEGDRLWIERRLTWLCDQFGRERLQFGTIALPTADFFPETYEPTEEGVQTLLRRVCDYMGIDRGRVSLAFFSQRKPVAFNTELVDSRGGAAGIYDEQSGRITIWLEMANLDDPFNVVATLAHELGHAHLLGDRRLTGHEPDHEPLTDLVTVFLGLGIFTANAVLRDRSWSGGGWTGFQIQRQGYLTAPLFGYALAWCAWCRREEPVTWRKYLRPDVRCVLDKGLKFLARSGAPRFPCCPAGPDLPPGAFAPQTAAAEKPRDDGSGRERGQTDEEETSEALETAVVEDLALAIADEYFERGMIHYQAGAFQEAIAAATEAIQRSPDDPELYTLRAKAHLAMEQYRDAREDAEKAVELDAEDTDARRVRGIALLHTNAPGRAIEDFDFLLDEDRHDADAYYHRGLAHAALGQHRRALADYSKAVTKAPNMVETYFARHQAYKELGDDAKAAADLKEGLWRRARLTRETL